jgi:YfiH family protein
MNKINRWLVPDWPAPANVHAATTLRVGGVSEGIYASLNAASHVGDDPERVRQNREIIAQMLGLPDEPVWLDQVHSNRVVEAQHPSRPIGMKYTGNPQQADASYTDESGVVCAVMTADCLPLLICSADGSLVAAIHAGWRGLLAGVISNTVRAMQNSAISSLCKREGRDLMVWLGPAIGPDCFEIGAEVYEAFLEKSAEFDSAFKEQNVGKWLADIYQLASIELAELNIFNVYGGDSCTVTEHDRFYSYRRDGQTGRMATLIWRE